MKKITKEKVLEKVRRCLQNNPIRDDHAAAIYNLLAMCILVGIDHDTGELVCSDDVDIDADIPPGGFTLSMLNEQLQKHRGEIPMKPGELVVHSPTGKKLTVKRIDQGSGFVLCSWIETKPEGERLECTGAFKWDELRYPTPAEKAEPESASTPEMAQSVEGAVHGEGLATLSSAGQGPSSPAPSEPAPSEPGHAEPAHKRRR